MISKVEEENLFKLFYKPESATYSGHHLILIPIDPKYIPSRKQQQDSIKLLIEEYQNYEIESLLTKEVQFISQGQNFIDVSCNHCKKEFTINYWHSLMDQAYETNFENLSFKTSCCNKLANLNDITYNGPAGFATYSLTVINPDYIEMDDSELITKLEAILKIGIRIVWNSV